MTVEERCEQCCVARTNVAATIQSAQALRRADVQLSNAVRRESYLVVAFRPLLCPLAASFGVLILEAASATMFGMMKSATHAADVSHLSRVAAGRPFLKQSRYGVF
jgi:hypothetical protein